MNIVTHALVPALLATPFLPKTSRAEFFRGAGIVALGGLLPDLVHPHLSLAARYASWSHSVFALGGFAAVLLIARLVWPRHVRGAVLLFAWLGFGLHMFADAVSGGIALYQPLSPDVVKPATRWIPYRWWWWSDLCMVLVAAMVWPLVLRKRPYNLT